MKHLKLFETKVERTAFVFTSENTPNVNFCEEDGSIAYQEAIAPKDPKLTRWYNGDTLIKELDVVGSLTSSYREESVTRCEIGSNVTRISYNAFSRCTSLTSITIPNSVTSIYEQAFSNCESLTSITIPNGVISIDRETFYHCDKLVNISIPNSVTSISNGAFDWCGSLTSIEIPNSVTSIGSQAFKDCVGITSIEIPNSVTNISSLAFQNCTSLTSVKYNGVTYTSKSAIETALTSNGVTVGSNIFSYTALAD